MKTLLDACTRVGKMDFLATHHRPILIQLDDGLGGAPAESPFGTVSLVPARESPAPCEARAFELSKTRSANPFSDMITVGRAGNNDIVLPSPCVSKFHAFFRQTPRGWALIDAGSSNGTHVDGRRLRPASVHLLDLRTSVALRFGNVACELLAPETLWDRARAMQSGSAA